MEDTANTLSAFHAILIVGGFLVGFPLFFLGIVYLISHISGWRSLATNYPAQEARPRNLIRTHSSVTGMVGMARYKNALRVGYNDQGLHLAVASVFAVAHPPLFIPWRNIQAVKEVGLIKYLERLSLTDGQTISLPIQLVDEFRAYLPPQASQ